MVRVAREERRLVEHEERQDISFSGILSIVTPFGSKWAGGSTCVPYWPTME